MKIAAAAVSAALFIAPVVLATEASAQPGCQQVTGRLSICPRQPQTPPTDDPQDQQQIAGNDQHIPRDPYPGQNIPPVPPPGISDPYRPMPSGPQDPNELLIPRA